MAIKNRANFVVPPLTPQDISSRLWPATWKRWQFISCLVQVFDWKLGAELGVWEGSTISYLLRENARLRMIGVDLWEAQPDNHGPEGYEEWDHDAHYAKTVKRCAPFANRCELYRATTTDAAEYVADGSLDFVFIDADHSEKGCGEDIDVWSPKLKPTGFLIGHDINWPSVKTAVEKRGINYRRGPDVIWFSPINGEWIPELWNDE